MLLAMIPRTVETAHFNVLWHGVRTGEAPRKRQRHWATTCSTVQQSESAHYVRYSHVSDAVSLETNLHALLALYLNKWLSTTNHHLRFSTKFAW